MNSASDSHSKQTDARPLTNIFERQRKAFQAAPYPKLEARLEHLRAFGNALAHRRQAFQEAVCQDFGHRSAQEIDLLELLPTNLAIKHAIENLHVWMDAEPRNTFWGTWPSSAHVFRQPLGVVGIISPWNYPVYLAAATLTGALAAGNRVILKPSEFAPASAKVWQNMIAEVFDSDQVHVSSIEQGVAEELSSLPLNHLHFTGSTRVGRLVAQAAAANLTPLTLELGGKSPTIIDKGYRIKKSIDSLVLGKLYNAGQSCVAPDYLLAHRDDIDNIVQCFKDSLNRLYPNLENNSDYTSIVNPRHVERLRNLRDDAQSKGAELIYLSELSPDKEEEAQKVGPCIIRDADESMHVIQEEIFGPLLPVIAYESIDEAFAYVASRPRPLAAYLYSNNHQTIQRANEEIISGSLGINVATIQAGLDDLPFGGVGESGMGSYHGVDGFLRFSHQKAVLQMHRPNMTQFLAPPFGSSFKKWILDFLLPRPSKR